MDIEKHIDNLKKGRALILKVIEGYSLEEINQIPHDFNNNIGWNIGHLVVTSYLIMYKLSDLELPISEEMVARYRKGTAPKDHIIEQKEWDEIIQHFVDFPNKLEQDYKDGIFKTFTEYTTSLGVTLKNIDKAISFNTFHEGIHLGVILSLRKLVAQL